MTIHLWACPRGGLAHAEHRLVLGTIQPTDREACAADPSHHGDVAVSEEVRQKMIQDWKVVQRNGKKKEEGSERKRGTWTCNHIWQAVSKVFKVYSVFTFTEMYYLALSESGGIISRVWAGPYRFTTNRLTDGMLEPACKAQEEEKKIKWTYR